MENGIGEVFFLRFLLLTLIVIDKEFCMFYCINHFLWEAICRVWTAAGQNQNV